MNTKPLVDDFAWTFSFAHSTSLRSNKDCAFFFSLQNFIIQKEKKQKSNWSDEAIFNFACANNAQLFDDQKRI